MKTIYFFISVLSLMLCSYSLMVLPRNIFYGILLSAIGAMSIVIFLYSIQEDNEGCNLKHGEQVGKSQNEVKEQSFSSKSNSEDTIQKDISEFKEKMKEAFCPEVDYDWQEIGVAIDKIAQEITG